MTEQQETQPTQTPDPPGPPGPAAASVSKPAVSKPPVSKPVVPRFDPVTKQRLPEKARRVRGGLRLKKKEDPPVFGWLGSMIANNFDGYFDAEGVEEGMQYARSGQTKSLTIEPGAITARIQGRRERAYNLTITLPTLSEDKISAMTDAFVDQAIHGARVIAGEMTPETHKLLLSLGIDVVPKFDESTISCGCEFKEPTCKHLRCVALVLAQLVDTEPLVLFRLRGIDTNELTEELRRLRTERAGGQRVAAPLPMNGLIPAELPEIALEDSIDNFWSCGRSISELETPIRPPEITHAILRRLGPSPFMDAKFPLVGLLATCYDAISESALSEPDDAESDESDV